jgi:hypothetical protein
MLDVSDAVDCPRIYFNATFVDSPQMMQDIKTEHNSVQANIARGLQVMLC